MGTIMLFARKTDPDFEGIVAVGSGLTILILFGCLIWIGDTFFSNLPLFSYGGKWAAILPYGCLLLGIVVSVAFYTVWSGSENDNIPIRLKQVAQLLREGGGHGRHRPA